MTDYSSFAEFKTAMDSYPHQRDGSPTAICETGEMYQEFFSFGLARPGDEKAVEAAVVSNFSRELAKYFEGRIGVVYWRKRLEFDCEPYAVVERFDDQGPDTDFMTGRRCYLDKNWRKIAIYCRVYRATKMFHSIEELRATEGAP